MATASFTRDFKVGNQHIESFVNNMSSDVKPAIDKNFRSSFQHVEEDKLILNKSLKKND